MKSHRPFLSCGLGVLLALTTLAVVPAFGQSALGDFVWEDLNRNGVQEAGEPGLSNVLVRLYDCPNNLLATATTDVNGFYLFVNLPPGGYAVRFAPPPGYAFTLPNVSNDALDSDANASTGFTGCYALSSGETNRTVDAGMFRPAVLGDFVWEDVNRNGVQDAGEPGVSNVMVRLYDCGNNLLAASSTDANGHYLFGGLVPGVYKVGFTPLAGYLFTQPDAGNDALDSDANATTGLTACFVLLSGQASFTVDAGLIRDRPRLIGSSLSGNGAFQFTFTNTNAIIFTVLATTNAASPAPDWEVLGLPMPLGGGLYQFTDPGATNFPRRFYRLRSP